MPDTAARAFRSVLLRAVIVPMLVMALLAAGLIWQIGQLNRSVGWVEHTDTVLTRLYGCEKDIVDMQAGVRGYLLTGDEAYLAPYDAGVTSSAAAIPALIQLTADRPAAGTQLREIERLRSEWIAYANERVAARRGGEVALPANYGRGNDLMNQVRTRFTTLIREEEDLRQLRTRRAQSAARLTMWIAGLATLATGLGLAFVSRAQLRVLSQRYESALKQSKELSTELERRVEERTHALSAANNQLGEANKELEAFAYSISHDLRAPMRHITGFAELLRHSPTIKLDADDAENLGVIHSTAVLAGRMVDDLLAFSRVGRTQLRVGEVDVAAIVQQCIAEVAPETRGRQVTWNVGALAPARGDAALLRMVFQNLINNAVKYTQKRDDARIEVAGEVDGSGTTYVVRDNGVGFDMAYVHKLFGVFQRLHRSEDFEGTGIGLANVRRIITRHGGHVRAEGMPDAGAAFYVHLPR